jgi:hypothetical protein
MTYIDQYDAAGNDTEYTMSMYMDWESEMYEYDDYENFAYESDIRRITERPAMNIHTIIRYPLPKKMREFVVLSVYQRMTLREQKFMRAIYGC